MGLATPTALMVGIGKAAQEKVLIKDATAVGDMSAPLAAGLLVAWTVGLSIIATAVTKMGDLRA